MFLAGRTGRWRAVITHFCPSPGREGAASVAGKEKGFIFRAGCQESHFNALPPSISRLPPPTRFWVPAGREVGRGCRGRRQPGPSPLEALTPLPLQDHVELSERACSPRGFQRGGKASPIRKKTLPTHEFLECCHGDLTSWLRALSLLK